MKTSRGHRARMKIIDDHFATITPEELEVALIECSADKEVPDCNKCMHVNITEEEQQKLRDGKFQLHYCTFYNVRIFHGASTLPHPDTLGPCAECNFEHNRNFKVKGEHV